MICKKLFLSIFYNFCNNCTISTRHWKKTKTTVLVFIFVRLNWLQLFFVSNILLFTIMYIFCGNFKICLFFLCQQGIRVWFNNIYLLLMVTCCSPMHCFYLYSFHTKWNIEELCGLNIHQYYVSSLFHWIK